jgi:hypothetical protein
LYLSQLRYEYIGDMLAAELSMQSTKHVVTELRDALTAGECMHMKAIIHKSIDTFKGWRGYSTIRYAVK